ncbi:MAG: hypothetical protein F4069_08845 [Rhodothermaceae bacterium]|nr:hypothetical protein [Rhodothermaceae bacterium]MYG70202.1 hypothetical protein [Rhodothermaceae bacterium]MYJ45413.1 hypothetical protein [Rhodothermaceae bacterium]
MLNRVSWMDEFLCEYVDGTMDYSVRAVFEECLECDSRLAKKVKHLRGTRRLLSEHSFRAPKDLRKRVRTRLSQCLPFATPVRPPHTSILVGTVAAIALAAALVAGTSQYIPAPMSGVRSAASPIAEAQNLDPSQIKRVNSGPLTEISPATGS